MFLFTLLQVTWVVSDGDKENAENYECIYNGSGKTPLLCAAIAFVGLAVAMVVEHAFMLIAISKSPPSALVTWDPNSPPARTITWQAGFFFVATWYETDHFLSQPLYFYHILI